LGVGVTATVVNSGGEAFVFDSLLYPEDTRELLRNIKEMNLKVKALINTHWHWDHTAGNQMFFGTDRIITHSLSSDFMRKLLLWDDFNKDLKEEEKVRTVYPNESVADGSVLEVGNQRIEFLHTPGHTPDSIIGWMKDERIIIAGDTVMQLPYIWYGDSKALAESLMRIQKIVGGGTTVQGHGGICEIRKLDGDIRYIENLRAAVAEYFNSGKTVDDAKGGVKLADCTNREEFESLPKVYEDVHSKNVVRAYSELRGDAGCFGG